MSWSIYRQQLAQARTLARLDPSRPQRVNLRRALSGAYYGLFHFLLERAARFLVGKTGDRAALRAVLSRAFLHTEMASAARTFSGGVLPAPLAPRLGHIVIRPELRRIARLFLEVQVPRHLADYDLAETFVRREVLRLIDDVEAVIADWESIQTERGTRLFLMSLLVWERIRSR